MFPPLSGHATAESKVRGRNRVALATIVLGFRLAPHVYYSVPLSHGRRLAAHQGHADPLGFLLGLAIMWVFVRGVWGLMWSG
jgi:hypothetical protein